MNFMRKPKMTCLALLCLFSMMSVDSQAAVNEKTQIYQIQSPPPPGVDLNFFRSKVRNNQTVILGWETSSEFMNQRFEIMTSRNSRDYTLLATVAGFGTTTEPQAYQYTNTNALQGRTYYKLIQVGEDGRSQEVGSLVVVIGFDSIGVIIAPNPVFELMTIRSEHPFTNNLQLFNAAGQLVRVIEPELTNDIYLGDLPRGLYMMVTEYGTKKIQLAN